MAEPFPKSRQLARGERRYRRKVASPAQWQRIMEEKGATCRIAERFDVHDTHIEYHHLLSRAQGGDDVAANIVPLCESHHRLITTRSPYMLKVLAELLSDAEYAYIVGKLGEGGLARLFGIGR